VPTRLPAGVSKLSELDIDPIADAANALDAEDTAMAARRVEAEDKPYMGQVFENTNLTLSKLNDIITHDDVSDSCAQEVLNQTDHETRDLTVADAVIRLLDDDFARGTRAEVPAENLGANEFAQKFRPGWQTDIGLIDVGGGAIGWDEAKDGDSRILCTPVQTTGTWELDFQFTTLGADGDHWPRFIICWQDADNKVLLFVGDSQYEQFRLRKVDAGTGTDLLSPGWASDSAQHTSKVTRDADGNFEIFLDGSSKGTATDTFWPTENNTGIGATSSGGGSVGAGYSLKVYS